MYRIYSSTVAYTWPLAQALSGIGNSLRIYPVLSHCLYVNNNYSLSSPRLLCSKRLLLLRMFCKGSQIYKYFAGSKEGKQVNVFELKNTGMHSNV